MMKLLWFSPLPPSETDVANFSVRLAIHLGELANVTFVHTGLADAAFPSVPLSSITPRMMNRADLCIYQIGNDHDFHGSILELAQCHPGLVILHDRSIHECVLRHLAHMQIRTGTSQLTSYRHIMARWHGVDGLAALGAAHGQQGDIRQLAERFPLFEVALDRALGVVSHNRQVIAEIQQRFPNLPSLCLSLPYDAPDDRPARFLGDSAAPFTLVMFGFMGTNRRLIEFVEAWGQVSHRDRFRLHLAGRIANWAQAEARLAELNLADYVTHHGFVTDAALDDMIRNADLAINLRNPTMGEASGSQLRIWANGCPSVVSDTGWYAELPDDAVLKVRIEGEHEDIVALLGNIATGRIDLNQISVNGFSRMKAHDPDKYCRDLMAWLDRETPRLQQYWFNKSVTGQLAQSYASITPLWFTPIMPENLLS